MNNYITIIKKDKNFINLIILGLLIVIIYSNATIIRQRLIILFPMTAVLLIMGIIIFKKRIYINSVEILWYVIITYLIFMLPFSYDFKESLIFICYYVISIMLMTLLKSYKRIQLGLVKAFYYFSIIFSLITILSVFIQRLIPNYFPFLFDFERLSKIQYELNRHAFSGLAGEVSYNMFSISIGFGIVLSIFLVSRETSLYNKILIFLMGISLLLTQKRSVIVIIILLLAFMLFVLQDKRVINRIVKVGLLLFIITIFLIIIFPDVLYMFDRFVRGGKLYLSGRDDLWRYALDMFMEKPLFGFGIGSYNIYCNNMGYFNGNRHAHNIYIQILAETGLFGIVLFGTVFLFSLFRTVKVTKTTMKLTNNNKLKVISLFSLYMQLFFLIYGIVGIPLYNFTQFLVYLLSVSISISVEKEILCR